MTKTDYTRIGMPRVELKNNLSGKLIKKQGVEGTIQSTPLSISRVW